MPRCRWSHQEMKRHQKKYNLTIKKIVSKTKEIIPRFGWLHQGIKCHQDKQNPTKTKISFKTEKKNHTNIHVTTIKWLHILIISLKVMKSLQGRESHTNTQKLDQDIKFTPRRTWPPWSNDAIRPTVWPCGRMLWSGYIPLENEQSVPQFSATSRNHGYRILVSVNRIQIIKIVISCFKCVWTQLHLARLNN